MQLNVDIFVLLPRLFLEATERFNEFAAHARCQLINIENIWWVIVYYRYDYGILSGHITARQTDDIRYDRRRIKLIIVQHENSKLRKHLRQFDLYALQTYRLISRNMLHFWWRTQAMLGNLSAWNASEGFPCVHFQCSVEIRSIQGMSGQMWTHLRSHYSGQSTWLEASLWYRVRCTLNMQ